MHGFDVYQLESIIVQKHRLMGKSSIEDDVLLRDLSWVKDAILEQGDEVEWSPASLTNVLQACSLLVSEDSFRDLAEMALAKVAHGCYSFSNTEYLSILSCMVHMKDTTMKTSALHAMEAALCPSDQMRIHTIVLEKGIHGFRTRDFGHLSWAFTELQCSQNIAEFIFEHAFQCVGEQNLSSSSLCLLCRMISIRGNPTEAEQNLEIILSCLERNVVLQRMSFLRDSTMMLLSISRLVKSVCDKEESPKDAISSGLKWTMCVVSYRKLHPCMGRIVDDLCSCILTSVRHDGAHADHSVYSGILYSLALLQYAPIDILNMCLEGLEETMNTLTLRTIATCSWSLSVLRYEDMHIMNVFATRVLDGGLIQEYDTSDVCQAISMILYSFSVLNIFKDEAFEPFLSELMNAAASCMSQMAPESLPIFGWSIMVSHSRSNLLKSKVFEKTMRTWRSEVADNAANIPKATLALVHHTEIALALEAPSLGLDMNNSFESSINLMYSSGRVKRYAMREWNTQQFSVESDLNEQILLDGVSLFQKQVYKAANGVYPGWMMEYWDEKLQYPVDMALPSQKVVIEADGPTHFTCNTKNPLGATDLKRRLLQKLGWNLVVVPYYEWSTHATQEEQFEYMSAKLEPILKETQDIPPSIAVSAEEKPTREAPPIETKNVQKNATTLDILQAQRGKMSLSQAMKRQILRKNKTEK